MGEIAAELGCSWHRVDASVRCWGSALLVADTGRISDVFALGLDETLMRRRGRFGAKARSTSIVDVGAGQLLDIVVGRTADGPARWLMGRPAAWRDQIRWAVLDLSGPYRAAFDTAIPDAHQVADPFHVVRLANTALDESAAESRTRPLDIAATKMTRCIEPASCWCRRLRTSPTTAGSACGACSTPATPTERSATPGAAEETLRSIYDITAPDLGAATVVQLASDLQDPAMPTEINRLGRTIWRWRTQIANWHAAHVTNAATEAANTHNGGVSPLGAGLTPAANWLRAFRLICRPVPSGGARTDRSSGCDLIGALNPTP